MAVNAASMITAIAVAKRNGFRRLPSLVRPSDSSGVWLRMCLKESAALVKPAEFRGLTLVDLVASPFGEFGIMKFAAIKKGVGRGGVNRTVVEVYNNWLPSRDKEPSGEIFACPYNSQKLCGTL